MTSKTEFGSKISSLPALAESLKGRLNGLILCLSYSWGGLEQVAAKDALDLGRLNINIKVLCLEGSPIHTNLASHKEVSVIPLPFRPRNFFDLKLKSELFRQLDLGVNLIHTHQTSLLGSIVPWLWSKPNVALFATRHILNNHDKKDFFHRLLYSRVDYLTVVSETLKRNVQETHAIRERRVKVIHLGLDFEDFDPAQIDPTRQRALWEADEGTLVIGLVGRIDPAKGQGTFIQAAAGLIKNDSTKRRIKFVIVGEETLGSSSTYLEELKQMTQQFGLEKSVVFAGFQKNIPEIMRAFDVFVMPSRQEAFGLVAIEAMAMECAVVISSGGSADEIVGSREQFGLKMRPEDAFDLQRQLRYLIEHPTLRKEMGQKARVHVLANYDRKMRLAKILSLYHQALRRFKA